MRSMYSPVIPAVAQAIAHRIGWAAQAPANIASLDQKHARGGKPQIDRVPRRKVVPVIGMNLLRPPISSMFWLLAGSHPTKGSMP